MSETKMLEVSAAAVERMARAVETVDWSAMGEAAYFEHGDGLAAAGSTDIDCPEAWRRVARAIYDRAARHIILAACQGTVDVEEPHG